MNQHWLVVGSPEHWQIAFQNGNIWGLQKTKMRWWERLCEGDGLVFYATRPIGGAIGLGRVKTKFKQDTPLWPQEVRGGEALWPFRFEFDVEFCLNPETWKSNKLKIDALQAIAQAGFQPLKERAADVALQAFQPLLPGLNRSVLAYTGLHEELKAKLAEIGKIQKFLAEVEYPMENARLDVVWRRVEKSVPTYVFEIQIGGEIHRALSKLKHAYDLWNSHIFIVAPDSEKPKIDGLVNGTFHEIRHRLRFIAVDKVRDLYERKKAYRELEESMGIP